MGNEFLPSDTDLFIDFGECCLGACCLGECCLGECCLGPPCSCIGRSGFLGCSRETLLLGGIGGGGGWEGKGLVQCLGRASFNFVEEQLLLLLDAMMGIVGCRSTVARGEPRVPLEAMGAVCSCSTVAGGGPRVVVVLTCL